MTQQERQLPEGWRVASPEDLESLPDNMKAILEAEKVSNPLIGEFETIRGIRKVLGDPKWTFEELIALRNTVIFVVNEPVIRTVLEEHGVKIKEPEFIPLFDILQ